MSKIDLQGKTKTDVGKIEKYWFENLKIGLPKTLFHRITIPLKPFDSGLTYVHQPETTKFVFDWYSLSLLNPNYLDGLDLSHSNYPNAECSVYIGSAHNWCTVRRLQFSAINETRYKLIGELDIDFKSEGVGENESFIFETEAE